MRRALAAALVLGPTIAQADAAVDEPAAIDVDRWTATATGWWAGLEDARVLGLGRLAVGITTSVTLRPIAFSTSAGAPLGAPVDHRATISLAAAYGVTDAIELQVVVPLVVQAGDRRTALGEPAALQRVATADLRVGGKIEVVARRELDVALAAGVVLPTGNEAHFAGDAGWLAEVRGLATVRRARLALGAGLGVRLRSIEVALSPRQIVGNELAGALAISYALPAIPGLSCDWTQLRVVAELDGVLGDDVGDRRGPSPVELRGGVRGRLWRGWTLGATVGRGLNAEIGAPSFRAAVDLAWRDTPRPSAPITGRGL